VHHITPHTCDLLPEFHILKVVASSLLNKNTNEGITGDLAILKAMHDVIFPVKMITVE
jgi:hypothetical protein